MNIKYSIKLVIGGMLCLALSGCYNARTNFDLYGKGLYSDLAKYEEEQLARADKNEIDKIEDTYYLCESYSNLKQYDKVFRCVDDLESLLEKNKIFLLGVPTRAPLIRASAYLELGNYPAAINEAKIITKELNVESPDIKMWRAVVQIRRLSLLSIAYALNNDLKNAEKELHNLEAFPIQTWGWGRILSEKRNCLARVYMALGKYDKVLDTLTEGAALATFSFLFRPAGNLILSGTHPFAQETYDSYTQLPRYFMINTALFETGNVEKAKSGFDSILDKQISSNGEIYWMALYYRGRIAEKEGAVKEAISFYRKAIDVIEQQRSTINTEVSKIGFVGNKQDVYCRLINVLYQAKEYEAAFEYVERSKARALVDLLATTRNFKISGNGEKEIRTALTLNESLEKEAINQDNYIDKNKTRGISIKARQDLKNKSPELASLVTVTSEPLAELLKYLSQDEELIEYYYSNEDMYAFIISGRALKVIKLDRKGLEEDIQKLRGLLERPGSSANLVSSRLYHRLFSPLEKHIEKKNLTIVPHGVLHYVPMNALHDGNGYLIDHFSLRMVPSANVLKYLNAKKYGKRKNILIFGNPDLGNPRYSLKYAEQEALSVASILPQSKVLLRKKATLGALREHATEYKYIHFATHGQFNSEAPLASAIFLAPDFYSNGQLTVDKLYSMQLDADLITLSACETGLGKIAKGDDIIGLTRGFFYAGCSVIVASLWKVDDKATAYLMKNFYQELNRNNKRESLRIAQLKTKKQYPHPFYWASFQLTGNDK